jgi:hypothetical protein
MSVEVPSGACEGGIWELEIDARGWEGRDEYEHLCELGCGTAGDLLHAQLAQLGL